MFIDLSNRGVVPIHGLNYKDKPDDVAAWLDDLGDPYTRTGADLNGRDLIDWRCMACRRRSSWIERGASPTRTLPP